MKTNQLLRTAVIFIVFFTAIQIQSQTVRDSLYDKTMTNALTQLDSAKNVQQLQQCKNLFERVAQKYSQEWLPAYYAAFCGINSVFYDMKSERNEAFLSEAEAQIEKLYTFPKADKSEINTLKAYYLTALTAMNPQVNGIKYFSKIIRLYETAMKENAENPRPVILLADYERRLPNFIRSKKRIYADEIVKAKSLFAKEQPNIEKPYWGRYFLQGK